MLCLYTFLYLIKNMKLKYLLLVLIVHSFSLSVLSQNFITSGRKSLAVIPNQVRDVDNPVKLLNGEWEVCFNPAGNAWEKNQCTWGKIMVPGEPAMQGFSPVNDKEFFYRKTIMIPDNAKDKTVLIRLNGVYSNGRVFVNGTLVREHHGGFTSWDADITEHIEPGKETTIYIGVTDRADDISYASGYAHHVIGGILRDVQLLLLPKEYINRLYIDSKLSEDYQRAEILLNVATSTSSLKHQIEVDITDNTGTPVVEKQSFTLDRNGQGIFSVTVNNPILWNQEQPYLYNLRVLHSINGKTEQIIHQKIGIRKVEVVGKQLLVNGQAVKLRGANRHDIHPLMGRSTNRYYDSLDVVLAKEANMNFIRTSHYPPSKDFLDFADKLGMYVQEETAICFVNDWRTGVYKPLGETQNNPAYTDRYLGQLCEMIDRDRNHPSVIMWSIGNESSYGINFQKSYDFVKSVDKTRPVSWSWPATAINEGKICFDIAVSHYPGYHGQETENFGLRYENMEHKTMPLLSDEWAHVACYCTPLMKADPNVKDYWGISMDLMWGNRFDVKGNLGGAIWGMIDEVFFLPDTVTGYGPWGFIDGWRRKKVEFWNTKKAHSPIKVLKTRFDIHDLTGGLKIPVKNRFSHISLNTIRMKVTQNNLSYYQELPALKPHEEGTIVIHLNDNYAPLHLHFYDENNQVIDEDIISFRQEVAAVVVEDKNWHISKLSNGAIMLEQDELLIQINPFDGRLIEASKNEKTILTDNPKIVLNVPEDPGAFKISESIDMAGFIIEKALIDQSDPTKVVVTQKGMLDKYPCEMEISYFTNGKIAVAYEIDSIPKHTWQIGVGFPVTISINEIQWEREGYWSVYPPGHLSANKGSAKKHLNLIEKYRVQPDYDVAQAMHDYYLTKTTLPAEAKLPATEAFRATKENIVNMQILDNNKTLIEITGQGNQAVKMDFDKSNNLELQVVDKWDYWTLAWGNFQGTENIASRITGRAEINIVW